MSFGGRCEETIQHLEARAQLSTLRHDGAPRVRDGETNRDYSPVKTRRQFVLKPGDHGIPAASGGHLLGAESDFGNVM